MVRINAEKISELKKLSTKNGLIEALAMDQRGALKKLMLPFLDNPSVDQMKEFKKLVAQTLTPYASAILLDPEFSDLAIQATDPNCGLLVAYEKSGYDTTAPGRQPDLMPELTVRKLKEAGADAIKILVYYDVDEPDSINVRKQVFIERIGTECDANQIPFFLEILNYDGQIEDAGSAEYARIRPHKVIESVKEFTKPQYRADVLKLEVPVTMTFVEGYTEAGLEPVYSRTEAKNYFKAQSDATDLPFIFLSAGVPAELFRETLAFAKTGGSQYNGVLCGRATWKGAVEVYCKEGVEAAQTWLKTVGQADIEALNQVVEANATVIAELAN
ncbi:MAG: tagatose 1,6-diphosphate aldolase [Bifidobacteriaceae bacterium]|jgi:tagatose 1,6-diphosphate aldolase|nr:tagatose 1,6-diphosphate aldolase [Bifidobacteriaceae bacterium]